MAIDPRAVIAPGATLAPDVEVGAFTVIGADVEIGPVAISHKNFVIETGGELGDQFVPLDPNERSTAKLKTLVDALNAVKVPTDDVIDILKGLSAIQPVK